jgi:hypothetical protein
MPKKATTIRVGKKSVKKVKKDPLKPANISLAQAERELREGLTGVLAEVARIERAKKISDKISNFRFDI